MSVDKSRLRRRGAAVTAALMLASGVAACGSSSSSSSSSASGSNASAPSSTQASASSGSSAEVTAAQTFIKDNAPGIHGALPSSAPKPPKTFKLWIMPCAAAASGCEDVVTGAQAAAKALGWNVTVFDGQGDPARWAQGIDQARVAGANAIITGAIDCAPVKQQLAAAKAAGMITINVTAFDCNSVKGGKALYSNTTMPAPGDESWEHTAQLSGELEAAWAIANKNGNVNAIQFANTEQEETIAMGAGFRKEIATCSTCKIVASVPFLLADLGAPIVQKASSALLKAPSANVAMAPYDPAAAPVAQAVIQAGKSSSVDVLGAIGAPASISLIRAKHAQTMSVGWDVRWLGWAAVDDVIRLADHQKPVYSGWALGIVDANHLPSSDQYHAPVDYESNYKKIWGVG